MGYNLVHRIQTLNIGPLFRLGWYTELANGKPGTLQRDYYCPICAGFQKFLPCQKPATAMTMDAPRRSYSPHGRGVTCLSATKLWWSLNFLWKFPFPSYSLDLTAPDAYIWGMLKESRFWSDDPSGNVPKLREKIVIFCVLATTCVHQHVQRSKGPLWTMCKAWRYAFWTHAVPMHLDMYCINYYML